MPSHPFDFEFQANIFSTPELTAIFDEKKRFSRWLEFEAALAKVQGSLGVIPDEAATEIGKRANLEEIDLELLKHGYQKSRNSIMPLVRALRAACREDLGEYVHYGATTQDVIDTGMIMELRDFFRVLYRDLRLLEEHLLALASSHKATPMIGRSHGQQATPITFGLKCAVWLSEIRRHVERIKDLSPRLFCGQLSGAVGTRAALGENGREVAEKALAELGLGHCTVSWHNSRDNIAEAANLMTVIATTLEKIANEIFELGKNEIGELLEPPAGKAPCSSTMPHKRNPVLCQRVSVLARHVRALQGTVTEAMLHEHERDARSLWSEWLAIPQMSVYTGTALNYIVQIVSGLEVHPEKMLANLRLHGDMVLSEWLLFRLSDRIGKMKAQEKLAALANMARNEGRSIKECLLEEEELAGHLTRQDLEQLDHPENHTGDAEKMIADLLLEIIEQRGKDPEKI